MGSVGHEGEKGWNSEQPSLGLRETDPQGLLASLVEHGLTPKIIQGCIPETQEGVWGGPNNKKLKYPLRAEQW